MTSGEKKPPKVPVRETFAKPLPRRFYSTVTTETHATSGALVLLDGRPAKTPGKRDLILPTLSLARAIAGEWAAQAERIDPSRMPLTRLANTALDGVAARAAEVRADVVKYAASDLVCYRADRPAGLVRRQTEHWDRVLAWAESRLGAPLDTGQGVVHVPQPAASLEAIRAATAPLDPFRLTALHTMTTLTGSALLALGVTLAAWKAEAAWTAAHVDEDWQIAEWGEDAEAAARRQARWVEMSAAARMLALLEDGPGGAAAHP